MRVTVEGYDPDNIDYAEWVVGKVTIGGRWELVNRAYSSIYEGFASTLSEDPTASSGEFDLPDGLTEPEFVVAVARALPHFFSMDWDEASDASFIVLHDSKSLELRG